MNSRAFKADIYVKTSGYAEPRAVNAWGEGGFVISSEGSVGNHPSRVEPSRAAFGYKLQGGSSRVTDGIEVTPCHLGGCHSPGLSWERLCRDAQVQLHSDLLKTGVWAPAGERGPGAGGRRRG